MLPGVGYHATEEAIYIDYEVNVDWLGELSGLWLRRDDEDFDWLIDWLIGQTVRQADNDMCGWNNDLNAKT